MNAKNKLISLGSVFLLILSILAFSACTTVPLEEEPTPVQEELTDPVMETGIEIEIDNAPAELPDYALATFAGGCFWCMEPPFEKLEGVHAVISGYTGGAIKDPTYKAVSSGATGHLESVQVQYDPEVVSYEKLLDVYWHQVNPTDAGGQFVDRGQQYTTAIFYYTPEQKEAAEVSKQQLEESGVFDEPIVTPILPAGTFYAAEEYHQDYYLKNPLKYKYYRSGSGRDQFLEAAWG